MAVSDAQRDSIAKYRAEKRDQLAVDVPKGKRDIYKQGAAELNLSLSMLIQNAVEEFIAHHQADNLSAAELKKISLLVQQTEKLSPAEKNLLVEFNKLPVETQKLVFKLIQSINQNSKQVE